MRNSLVCVVLVCALSPLVAFADFERGIAAYRGGDYATAYREFRADAVGGDVAAQYILALMYQSGLGVTKNDTEAVRWYLLAAEQGLSDAQFNLALVYDKGQGVPKNDTEAVRWYLLAAEQGHAAAQFNLAQMYRLGQGVPKNDTEAVRWYRLVAEQGHAAAQFILALMYKLGEDVPKNDTEAVRWFHRAAEQGLSDAQFILADMYRKGQGVPKNDTEAVRWYLLAAEQGLTDAQFNLAQMYRLGQGVPKNDTEAVRWYRLAAEQGHAAAQYNLALMYYEGQGVPKNLVRTYMWESLAAAQGHENARKNLAITERQMTREQIAEAQRLAAAFRPRAETSGTQQDRPSAPSSRPQAAASETVRNIQQHLTSLGYDPGPADGLIGARTTRAIQAFQRDAGIEPDGIASSTMEALLSAMVSDRQSQQPEVLEAKLISSGTGFFVTSRGHVLTNHHVIDGCEQIRVALPQGSSDAQLIAVHRDDDLAVLQTDVKPPVVASFRRTAAALGEDIAVAGYPLHGFLSGMNLTTGSISSTSGLGGDVRYLQITAPVQRGNSGGPLLDNAGSVVGVIVAKLDAVAVAQATGDIPQNVNFAIKSAVARSFLSIHDIEFLETPPAEDRSRTVVAAEAQRHTVLVECWK